MTFATSSAPHLSRWIPASGISKGPLFPPLLKEHALDRPKASVGVNRALKRAARGAGFSGEEVAALSGHWPRVGAEQDLMTVGRNSRA